MKKQCRMPGSRKQSAGIIAFRIRGQSLQVLLVHPGGPYWAKKQDGCWSIPKGLYEKNEMPIFAAQREFEEETGLKPVGELIDLGKFKQPGGKTISVWGLESDFDLGVFKSNLFSMEWPPKSGKLKEFPEADKAAWFDVNEARQKILKGQLPIIEALVMISGDR